MFRRACIKKNAINPTLALLSILVFFTATAARRPGPDDAKLIAATSLTKEVKEFYSLNNGQLRDCIERKVERSCKKDFLRCRENSWVVSYDVKDSCPVQGDRRFGVFFVVNNPSGKIMSRYPEMDYMKKELFCRQSEDCVASSSRATGALECRNFMNAPLVGPIQNIEPEGRKCICRSHKCDLIGSAH